MSIIMGNFFSAREHAFVTSPYSQRKILWPLFSFACVENANQTSLLFSCNVSRHFLIGLTLKCVSDPQIALVFEHEVHHITQLLDVSWNKARVFHFRNCPAPCDMPTDMEVDTNLQKYGERLKKNVITSIANAKVLLQSNSLL